MGLHDVVAQASKIAFTVIGDLKVTATYITVGTESYNADTGAISSSDTNTIINGVLDKFKKSEIDGEKILSGDMKLVALKDWFITTPKIGDKMTFGGSTWLVKNFWEDVARVMYAFQLRML